jgi:hypothetical protein
MIACSSAAGGLQWFLSAVRELSSEARRAALRAGQKLWVFFHHDLNQSEMRQIRIFVLISFFLLAEPMAAT